jgi:ParB family chromosome partitioning protein
MAAKLKKSGLGRDFNSLFEDNMIEKARGAAEMLRISDIEPNRAQPRKYFDESELASLAASIATFGLLQPIVVTENEQLAGTYRIIAGERRWRASRIAGLTEIPAVIVTSDGITAAEMALVENIQRSDLSPVEEAMGYRDLINTFGLTQEQVADKVGKSRSAVTNALRLLDLPEETLEMLADGRISQGHAKVLLGLNDKSLINGAAEQIIAEDLSVRATERLVKILNTPVKEKKTPAKADEQRAVYLAELERRAQNELGRRIRIRDLGEGKSKLEIDYQSSEDLEELLRKLCGDSIFDN